MDRDSVCEFDCSWPVPEVYPPLAEGELHVWCAPIDVAESLAHELAGTLAVDERVRAQRYFSDRHRRRFIACRAAQRMILSAYVGAGSHELEFVYSPLGKPAFAGSGLGVKFNVSNSSDLALFAVARDRELGVDLEHIRDNIDDQGLAERFFSPQERDQLLLLPEDLRLAGFFDCWTRKEAFLKAIGKGLTYPLDRAIVSVGLQEPCRLVSLDGDAAAAAQWSLFALQPAPGYVGAIATPGQTPRVKMWRWEWTNRTPPPS